MGSQSRMLRLKLLDWRDARLHHHQGHQQQLRSKIPRGCCAASRSTAGDYRTSRSVSEALPRADFRPHRTYLSSSGVVRRQVQDELRGLWSRFGGAGDFSKRLGLSWRSLVVSQDDRGGVGSRQAATQLDCVAPLAGKRRWRTFEADLSLARLSPAPPAGYG